MANPRPHQIVECKTIDGVTLEGWFWEVDGPAPVVIMTHGLNCVKEMSLPETAVGFQKAGYNVLLYDSRSIGGSGGSPRNQIDPWQNAEDISDVVSYVETLPSVDPRRIVLFGLSSGGTISACAAAIDVRVAALVMVCPIFKFIRPDKRKTAFTQLIKDRRSQLKGNKPYTLQPFNSKGENPIGYAGSGGPGGIEAYHLMRAAVERGHDNFRDRITLQSYCKMAHFRPASLLREMLDGVPSLMVVPEMDNVSLPEDQKAVFESLKCEKRLYLAERAGHMSVLSDERSARVLMEMVGFVNESLRSKGAPGN
ncbi:Alpha/Beta hydrolase protein [Xylariomycetidae sp. FL2044]|nr:Alpha/Beta hydrolase protein [Xylariomycetidae sp. FL2044]